MHDAFLTPYHVTLRETADGPKCLQAQGLCTIICTLSHEAFLTIFFPLPVLSFFFWLISGGYPCCTTEETQQSTVSWGRAGIQLGPGIRDGLRCYLDQLQYGHVLEQKSPVWCITADDTQSAVQEVEVQEGFFGVVRICCAFCAKTGPRRIMEKPSTLLGYHTQYPKMLPKETANVFGTAALQEPPMDSTLRGSGDHLAPCGHVGICLFAKGSYWTRAPD